MWSVHSHFFICTLAVWLINMQQLAVADSKGGGSVGAAVPLLAQNFLKLHLPVKRHI